MNRDLARQLLPIVNDKDLMERLQAYVSYRIELHRDNLEKHADPERMWRLQAQILELRRLSTLRDEVLKAAE